MYPGDRGYYDGATRKVHCLGCGSAGSPQPRSHGAGASTGREYRRRRAAREHRFRQGRPFGGVLLALLKEPQHQRAWATGEAGERKGAKALERHLAGSGVVVIHDRRKPGSRGNIDHVCIGPGGVTVIDTKKLSGAVRVRQRGLLRPQAELRIGGREKTHLVAGVEDQVRVVRALLTAQGWPGIEVRGALQFVDADLPWVGLPGIREVLLGRPRKVAKLAGRSGSLTAEQTRRIVDLLNGGLPPA